MKTSYSFIFTLAVVFFSAFAIAADDEKVDDPDVIVLTKNNFDSIVNRADLVLVEFYAPWCGHCKRLAPEYAKAATELKKNDPPISLAKVDATQESELAGRFQVSGYPTMKIFRNGRPSDYNGPRDAAGIVAYMKKQAGPAVLPLDKVEQLDKLLAQQKYAVVGFFPNAKTQLHSSFVVVADRLRDKHRFAKISAPEALQKYGVDAGSEAIIAFKKFDDGQTRYTGDTKTKNLESFVIDNSLPLVGEITKDNRDEYLERRLPILRLYAKQDFSDMLAQNVRYFVNRLSEVAKENRGKLLVGLVNTAHAADEMDQLGFSKLTLPAVTLVEPSRQKFMHTGTFSAAAVKEFVSKYHDGALQSYRKSEPAPAQAYKSGDVAVVTGNNFEDVVLDSDKDVLIEFYAPWCGHCRQLEPKYKELAKKFKKSDSVVIAKIDATANDYPPQFQVSGFPTIFMVPAGKNSSPIQYSGDRDVDDMASFVRKHAKRPLSEEKKKKKKQRKSSDE